MSIHHLIFVFQTFLIVVSQTNKNSTSIDIYILGLFPMDGHFPAGIDVKPGVEIALDSVNRNPNILPGYRLNMMWNNSRVHIFLLYIQIINLVASSYLQDVHADNDLISEKEYFGTFMTGFLWMKCKVYKYIYNNPLCIDPYVIQSSISLNLYM